MAIAYLQSNSIDAVSIGTTAATAFSANVTAASVLVAAAFWSGTGAATASDNKGNTWVAIGSPLTGAGTLLGLVGQLFYSANAAAGATTVTLTTALSTTERMLSIHEYSGLATAGVLDQAGNQNTSSATPNTVTLTTTTANQLLFAFWVAEHTTSSVDNSFTEREYANNGHNPTADRIVSSTGSYAGQITEGASGNNITCFATFSATTIGGGVTNNQTISASVAAKAPRS